MVAWLGSHHGLEPVDAYVLWSVIADPSIREIVDPPATGATERGTCRRGEPSPTVLDPCSREARGHIVATG